MRKYSNILILLLINLYYFVSAQTDQTVKIINSSFETGNSTGWIWSGTTGYAWCGVNTDGDATKTGSYIIGTWNSIIGDVQLSQKITGLNNGIYKVTTDLMGSKNATTSRQTTQRLFANEVSQLFGKESAYSLNNLNILKSYESVSFGGYTETQSDAGPFKMISVLAPVTNGELTMGIRSNGKGSELGYSFPDLTAGDGHGWFKADHFTLTYMGELSTEQKTNASLRGIHFSSGKINPVFDSSRYEYTVTLTAGTSSVIPYPVPEVYGVSILGAKQVDLSSGSGTSVITVQSLDSTVSKIYTITYKVEVAGKLSGEQQQRLYTNEFPLKDVALLDGPFKHARDLNLHVLEDYDVDRLLAPYRKEAGLSAKAVSYPNWIGLDGHIGGHYLTALAINYAATSDSTCKQLMDYMVNELKTCQDSNSAKHTTWGIGYCGGVPNSAGIWPNFRVNNLSAFYAAWVPWYNLHKTYAGLRDAWLYGDNQTAKDVFLKFCDWGIHITSGMSDAQMESMLGVEHGGMNEIYADAYQMTGDIKYLTAAKRFSHKYILNSMIAGVDNLNNQHANTQVPKIVGFERVAETGQDLNYQHAAEFFWTTVTENRSLAFGGNSRKEFFPAAESCLDYINNVEGPESCNTNNMLKLTGDLFRNDPQAKYADFYERAMFNHILSSQHPNHGGYVYFTPARPQHYRVYSAPNQAMWCCVGTGMENHGKYGEFIYTRNNDDLYLNLFVASELNWAEKKIKLTQETTFPNEEKTKLTISAAESVNFTLQVRSPQWVDAGKLKIIINKDTLAIESTPQSYIPVNRTWNDGDIVQILFPMHNSIEQMPNVSSYIAIMHGPILLGARTGTENLTGLVADDSRWGHIANGSLLPLDKAPIIVSDRNSISLKIEAIEGESMRFKAPALFTTSKDSALVLEPFSEIHDSRYMIYWMALTKEEYQNVLDSLEAEQKEALKLESRTLDRIGTGEQQPEVDHKMQTSNSSSGVYQNIAWRDATNGGYFSYEMDTQGKSDLSLFVQYWGNEGGSRSFNIFIDDQLLTTENIVGKWNLNQFMNIEYPIPNSMTEGKTFIRVKFQGINSSNVAGGVFYLRLLKELSTGLVVTSDNNQIEVKNLGTALEISGLKGVTSVFEFNIMGQLLDRITTENNTVQINTYGKGIRILKIISKSEKYIESKCTTVLLQVP